MFVPLILLKGISMEEGWAAIIRVTFYGNQKPAFSLKEVTKYQVRKVERYERIEKKPGANKDAYG